ncbi:MAG: hypothetical protein LEGION0398_MBIBDBAK_00588 [Legionellaceae bacterium]
MKKSGDCYRLAFSFALGFHILLFGFFFFKFSNTMPVISNPNPSIIHVTTINANALQPQKSLTTPIQKPRVKPILPVPTPQKMTENKPIEQKPLVNKQKIIPLEKKVSTTKKENPAKPEKLAKPEVIKDLPLPEKKTEETLKQSEKDQVQKALELKKTQEKASHDLKQQLALEEEALNQAAIQNARIEKEIDRYKAIIIEAIGQQWIVPDNTKEGLSCKIRIRLAPGGMVLNVKLLESSGDPALDRSALAAVTKASPLPVPTETVVFDAFREIDLIVQPTGTL